MPSHALILPVEVECFLNASSKCRVLPDGYDWDSAAGRDSSRSTSLPDSLLQRTVQEVICQSSLQRLLLSERKMYEMWRKIVCRRRRRLSYSMRCRPEVWGNVLFESKAVYFRIFLWILGISRYFNFDFDQTLRRRRKPFCFFHCLVFICVNSSIKYPPRDLLVLWRGWKRSHCRDAGLQSCRNILLQTCFLLCTGGNKRLY